MHLLLQMCLPLYGLHDVFLGTSVSSCPSPLLPQMCCQTATLVGPAVPHCMLGSVCVSKLKFLQHQTAVQLAGELPSCASLCMHFLYAAESPMASSVWQVTQKQCSRRKERWAAFYSLSLRRAIEEQRNWVNTYILSFMLWNTEAQTRLSSVKYFTSFCSNAYNRSFPHMCRNSFFI